MTSLRRLTYSLKSNPGGLQNSSMIDFVISPSWVTFYASSSVYGALFLIVCEEETSDPRTIISIRYGFSKTCFKSKVSWEKLTLSWTTASSFPHELCLRRSSQFVEIPITPTLCAFICVQVACFPTFTDLKMSNKRMILLIRFGLSSTWGKSLFSVEKFTLHTTIALSVPLELYPIRDSWLCRGGSWCASCDFVEFPWTSSTFFASISVKVARFPIVIEEEMSDPRKSRFLGFCKSKTGVNSPVFSLEIFILNSTCTATSVPHELGSENGLIWNTFSICCTVFESFSAMNFAASIFMVHVFWAYELAVWHAVSSFSIMETTWTIWKGGRGSWLIDL